MVEQSTKVLNYQHPRPTSPPLLSYWDPQRLPSTLFMRNHQVYQAATCQLMMKKSNQWMTKTKKVLQLYITFSIQQLFTRTFTYVETRLESSEVWLFSLEHRIGHTDITQM